MTIKIELDDIEVLRIIYELRRNARSYKRANEHHLMEGCLLVAARIENQEYAQRVKNNQCQDEHQIKKCTLHRAK